jgi:membrane-associated phospholipid phosphatase
MITVVCYPGKDYKRIEFKPFQQDSSFAEHPGCNSTVSATFVSMPFLSFTFWPWLQRLDENLFKAVNHNWSNPLFDAVMPFLRKSNNWFPLYALLLVFVLVRFKWKALWWILFFIITVSLTDSIGTYVFKYGFQRIRPCNEPGMLEQLRLLVVCPSGYGFMSNHAANHFGMATFLFLSFRHLFKTWMWIAFLWAGSIAYAQVYVGVHYPMDIICGAGWGILAGSFTGYLYNRFFGPLPGRQT